MILKHSPMNTLSRIFATHRESKTSNREKGEKDNEQPEEKIRQETKRQKQLRKRKLRQILWEERLDQKEEKLSNEIVESCCYRPLSKE